MIQWFPGHMAKALREMEEHIKLVELICIILDARVPKSSINPKLEELFQNKKVLYIFSKSDKADNVLTQKWLDEFRLEGKNVLACDVRDKKCIKEITKIADVIMAEKHAKDKARGLKKRPVKTMIVGVPNVGKSTLINTLCGKRVAVTGDKPGVTKNEQWTQINEDFILLDTPGVLWPKFENETTGYNLLISGAIKDSIVDFSPVGIYFLNFLNEYYPNVLNKRYGIDTKDPHEFLKLLALKQGYVFDNNEIDLEKTIFLIIQEYRNGYLGKITLDQIC